MWKIEFKEVPKKVFDRIDVLCTYLKTKLNENAKYQLYRNFYGVTGVQKSLDFSNLSNFYTNPIRQEYFHDEMILIRSHLKSKINQEI